MNIFLKRKVLIKVYLNLMEIKSLEEEVNIIVKNQEEKFLKSEEFVAKLKLLKIKDEYVPNLIESIFIEKKWKCLKTNWVPMAYILEKYGIHKGNNYRHFDEYEGPKENVMSRWFVHEKNFIEYLDEHFNILR